VSGTRTAASEPAVSVIVPAYNLAEHVGDAVESLRLQSFRDFEAIVIDDGSTDDTAARARAAAEGDRRFRVLTQPNGGLSAARNAGLEMARAPVIGFLDGDDRFHRRFLEVLLGQIQDTGAPWAACAVALASPGGETTVSAIHGMRHPATGDDWTTFPLDGWQEIIRHWPSAWNKLYRRDLIGETRFAEGLYYEDHPWYQTLAAKAGALPYTPRPLYLHTRRRPGQITAEDSDRVFDVFEVIDQCADVMTAVGPAMDTEALARFATRVIDERARAVTAPRRRARLASRTRATFARRNIHWSPDWDSGISRAFGRVLSGRLPLSVVIPTDGRGPGLVHTLESLAERTLRDAEILVVPADQEAGTLRRLDEAAKALNGAIVLPGSATDVPQARNAGLAVARGLYTVFLDAGDTLPPPTLWIWVEAMLRTGADLGVSRFAPRPDRVHAGCHDRLAPHGTPWPEDDGAQPLDWLQAAVASAAPLPPGRALALHAHPSAKIFRTAFLREALITFPPEPLSSWDTTMRAALLADRVIALGAPGPRISGAPEDRRFWRWPQPPEALHEALMRLAPLLDPTLGRARWYPTLLARALWEKSEHGAMPEGITTLSYLEQARALIAETCAGAKPDPETDPYIGPRIRTLFLA
jgi:glycosyltransferase involved in cell wall biosynthesis